MAKTMRSIKMDYSRAKAQAEKLEEIAQSLRSLVKKDIEQTREELLSGWRGENARLFVDKEQRLAESVGKTAEELDSIAAAIRRAARELYEADKRAAEIAAAAASAASYTAGGGGYSSGGGGGGFGGGGGGGGRG